MPENKYTNKLINEKSPYLLQHAHNPVDWFPWGEEAFRKALGEDKPVFLSIGYSTCHWCHVMERESFEDIEVADVLNNNYISIKVDREERPDIDHIYMSVCQALTGSGGWPLSVFLTPDKKPFYAGTYYPKKGSMGLPGFIDLLQHINKIWRTDKKTLLSSTDQIIAASSIEHSASDNMPSEDIIHSAFASYKRSFDKNYGGFSKMPKFPSPHNLYFLLRYYYAMGEPEALTMVERTLSSMYQGGIYDHIGSGFCRYSTDNKWLAPHFEKMLYDNALLAIAYLEAYQITKNELYKEIARDVLDYILRDMTCPEGGFYSAEDADSEGVEGKFYLWTKKEVLDILGETDGEKMCALYDITDKGNFEGKNIPNLILNKSEFDIPFIKECKTKLFVHRENRIHPFKDKKILTSWNGLMIAAMAIAGRVIKDDKYTKSAEKAAAFLLSHLSDDDGKLLSSYTDGVAKQDGFVDDYSFFIWGLIELYSTTFEPVYLHKALNMNDYLIKHFWDERDGGLYIYGKNSEQLFTRPKEFYDGATPSGNSVAAMNFIRLFKMTSLPSFEEMYRKQLKFLSDMPLSQAHLLTAFLHSVVGGTEVVLIGEDTEQMQDLLKDEFRPFTETVLYKKELISIMPYIENYKTIDNAAKAYVCKNFKCNPPVSSIEKLKELLA